MGSRALGELLLRPGFLRRTPAWPAPRSISTTPPPSRKAALSPDQEQSSPAQQSAPAQPSSPRDAASQAVDALFAPSSTDALFTPSSTDAPRSPQRVFGSEFSRPSRTRARPIGLQFDAMAMPESLTAPSLANKPSAATLAAAQTAAFENYPRLSPAFGRAVDLDASRGRDIVRGIGMLGSLIARNSVKRDVQRQRYHERRGLKRKRVNSERWRARFKTGFQGLTARVVELTRKGW